MMDTYQYVVNEPDGQKLEDVNRWVVAAYDDEQNGEFWNCDTAEGVN